MFPVYQRDQRGKNDLYYQQVVKLGFLLALVHGFILTFFFLFSIPHPSLRAWGCGKTRASSAGPSVYYRDLTFVRIAYPSLGA